MNTVKKNDSGIIGVHPYSSLAIYLSLLANVILFFHKPLFSSQYLFPWDFRGVQLPLISFLVDRLRQGHFALWNPYSYCGYPVFANIEACYFQPFVLAAAFLAAHTNPEALPQLLEWAVALQIFIAGVASYHLFRNLGAAPAPAWSGALIFETGGFFASRAEHIGAIMAVVWMPLAWLALWKIAPRFNRRWFAVLALALGLAVLGGFPQPTLAVFLSVVVFALALLAFRMASWRALLFTAAACLAGLALSAVIFIPTTQLAHHSVAMYRSGWLGQGGGIPPQSFVSLVAPNYFHIFDSSFSGPGDRTFLYLYCSLAGLALALYAVLARRERTVWLLASIAAFGAWFSLGEHTPLWRALYPLLPERIRIGIHPEYCYCIFTLALAGLAALGLDRLRLRGAVKVSVGILIAADLFFTGAARPMNLAAVREEPGVTRDSFAGSAQAMEQMRRLVNTASPPWRVDNMEGASPLWAVQAPLTRVPSANGISPLALENIIQLRLLLHDGHPWGWYYPVDHFESPILDLLNVRYLTATGDNAARLASSGNFLLAANIAGEQVFENPRALPRFFFVEHVVPASSPAKAKEILAAGLDVSHWAVALGAPSIPALQGRAQTRVLSYDPDQIELQAVAPPGGGFLVLSENDYPGWNAWIDGRRTVIYLTDVALRGVVVPAGTHEVRMAFEPTVLYRSVGISLVTLLFLLFVASPWRPGS